MNVYFVEKHEYSDLKNILGDNIEKLNIRVKRGDRVLIKPNLLTDKPLAITKYEFLKGVVEIFKDMGADVEVGDSPGNAGAINNIVKVAGLDSIPVRFYFFDEVKEKKIVNGFHLTRNIEDYDFIVNLPRLKTHVLTTLTLGTKNLYGFIPGGYKKSYHISHPDPMSFSSMLVSLYKTVKTHLTILDAIVGMQGNGPNNGYPVETGFIAFSRDPLMLDIAVAEYLSVDKFPLRNIFYGLGYKKPIASGQLPPPPPIEIPRSPVSNLPSIGKFRKVFFPKKPRYRREKCTGCKACVHNCPAKALTMENGNLIINYSRCIECYTCIEVCNFDALEVYNLTLKRRLL